MAPTLTLCGNAASRFAGPAFGCPAAFGLVFAAPRGGAQRPSGGRAGTDGGPMPRATMKLPSTNSGGFSLIELDKRCGIAVDIGDHARGHSREPAADDREGGLLRTLGEHGIRPERPELASEANR